MHWFDELVNQGGQWLHGHLQPGSLTAIGVVFLAGLLTSLTPCVYPMIPVTVTYIGGAAGGNRRRTFSLSFVYVLALAVVYAALGVTAPLLGKTFGMFTRSPWVYGPVGVLFVLFGLAMLDLFTIPIPGFASGMQARGARRGGYLGAALMGVASGFVAAPCAAPVLSGLLAYVAQTRNAVWGGTLMFVFALGLGTLLMLLGIFSGLLASLPRSGPWMVWIKKGFGIILILIGGSYLFNAVQMARGLA
jgi:cytochrome c-type biogenesis protein